METSQSEGIVTPRPSLLKFGDFQFDLRLGELRRSGDIVSIRPKQLRILSHLIEQRHRVVSKEELLEHVWNATAVSEEALTSALRDLRRTLGDVEAPHRIIVTIRARGYRFGADISEHEPASDAPREARHFEDRDDVIARLRASSNAAAGGAFRLSLLAGPPGIGKTRAAAELVRSVRLLADVHVARCHGGEGASPLWPWTQIVRSCLSGRAPGTLGPVLESAMSSLGWMVPEFWDVSDTQVNRDLDRLETRSRLFDATGLLLKELSAARPLVLFIDDLHWADDASLLLLEFLSLTLVDVRVHLVGAFRDGEARVHSALSRVLGAVARRPESERLDLTGLRRDSVERILTAAAGRAPTRAFLDRLWRATGGNPFFVCELADLVSSGRLDVTDDARVPLPGRVRDAVYLQLERTSPECRDLLKLASLLGKEPELPLLSRASGLPQIRVLELLEDAEAAGILARVETNPGGHAFTHDLVREALTACIGSSERIRLHRRIATALESLDEHDRLSQISHHYCEAALDGVADRALAYAERAAEQANALTAYEDAVGLYDRALGVLPLVVDAPRDTRCRLLVSQAEAAWGTGESAEGVRARLDLAREEARMIRSPDLFARAALGRTGHQSGAEDYREIGRIDTVDIESLREAAELLGERPTPLRARVLARLSLAVRYTEPLDVSDELSAQAVAVAEQLDDPVTLASALRYRHEVLSGPQFARERLLIAERVLALARAVRSRPLELDGLFFLSYDHFVLGDVPSAKANGDAADALASTMRHPGAHFRSGTRRVLRLTLQGKFDAALRAAEELCRRDATRNLGADGTYSAQKWVVFWLRGEHASGLELMRAEAKRGRVFRYYWIARHCAALGHMEEGRAELLREAEHSFRRVSRDHTFLDNLLVLAELCRELGDVARARELYEIGLPFEEMIIAPHIATLCTGAFARVLGILADVIADYDAAGRHFERAVAIETTLSRPLLAETLVRYGGMLRRRGRAADRDRSTALLGKALEIADAHGMRDVQRSATTWLSL